jgi:hypothetical protein
MTLYLTFPEFRKRELVSETVTDGKGHSRDFLWLRGT